MTKTPFENPTSYRPTALTKLKNRRRKFWQTET
jgi:hypothetical protein